jgi:hypothetical protein
VTVTGVDWATSRDHDTHSGHVLHPVFELPMQEAPHNR